MLKGISKIPVGALWLFFRSLPGRLFPCFFTPVLRIDRQLDEKKSQKSFDLNPFLPRFFFFFLFLCLPLFSQEILLKPDEISSVMEQFFALHVEHKEMSPQLHERSLKIYLHHFDQSKAYLLNEEVVHYERPNEKLLSAMQSDYENNRFSTYFTLNRLVQQSILRAQEWRSRWAQNPKTLLAEAKKVNLTGTPEKHYAKNRKDLQNRHYDRFLRFLAFQMEELGYPSYEGKEAKLVALCEKQVRIIENMYLGIDERGEPLSQEMHEHLVCMRTLKALAHSLDAHTAYYSPEEAYAMKVQLEKGMYGIGVVLREGIDGISIQELIKGGPAESCGKIQKGDTIVEVDGIKIENAPFHKVLEMMRGKEGTKTRLGLLRHSDQTPHLITVDLVRKKITLDDKRVDYRAEPFGDGLIGKITLHSFYEGEDGLSSEKDLKQAIDALKEQGPLYGIVLDMRENGGGFLTQAVKVSGLFISSGVVVISKYSDGTMKYYRALDGERYFDGPLVVLISRNSASATEIVAQTLKDYGVALVVGDDQTFGKGTIQHQTVTSGRSESFFKVTVGRYYTVSGKSTQIQGVKSDIIIPTPYQFEEIGEGYLEYPLPPDQVASAFADQLSDVDPFARKWFQKYYIPNIQPVVNQWNNLIPQLRINSEKRLTQNRNFQNFLQKIKRELKVDLPPFGSNDLQMDESVNIIKDMIFLSNH